MRNKHSLSEQIRRAYEQYPQADGQKILEVVGCKDTVRFREALVAVQKRLRCFTAEIRRNHNAHPFRVSG